MARSTEYYARDLMHYLFVFSILLGTWVPVMNFFHSDLMFTAATVFVLFIASDKLAHYVLKVK